MANTTNWHSIIWREWRNCQDVDYAKQLFILVSNQPLGWGAKLSLILFDAIAGAALAIIIIAPFTLIWSVLQQLALAGLVVGAARGYLVGRSMTWEGWLKRLESNTPLDNMNRLVGGLALLGICGFLMFGPLFWLVMLGFYWAFGGLITWINHSTSERDTFNPKDRRWWFWWHTRPSLPVVIRALEQACLDSGPARKIWTAPLDSLARQQHPDSPKALIANLLHQDWRERFVARCALVSLGSQAADPLHTLAEHDRTPLRETVLWLLENIQTSPLERVS